VAILGNFVNRALVLTNKYYDGEVPAPGTLLENDKAVLSEIQKITASVEKSIESFRFREAVKLAMDLARLGNKYLADTEPWKVIKTDPERVKTIMYIALQITAALSLLLQPFLPFSMEKLRKFIGFSETAWDVLERAELLQPGHRINQPDLLFEKIEDEAIDQQLEKLKKTKEAGQKEMYITPQKPEITFDDFTKMDIRTATILEAEKVPKTKKLIKMVVDTGIDIRTIVSGIAGHYEPENLPGKKVCVLANLAPRNIKGIESQGMILLSENSDGQLIFIEPGNEAHNGAEVN